VAGQDPGATLRRPPPRLTLAPLTPLTPLAARITAQVFDECYILHILLGTMSHSSAGQPFAANFIGADEEEAAHVIAFRSSKATLGHQHPCCTRSLTAPPRHQLLGLGWSPHRCHIGSRRPGHTSHSELTRLAGPAPSSLPESQASRPCPVDFGTGPLGIQPFLASISRGPSSGPRYHLGAGLGEGSLGDTRRTDFVSIPPT